MPWVRFADNYLLNPKIMCLGPLPRLLDVSAIIYSARELRDGRLSQADVVALAAQVGIPRWRRPAAELVEVGRWHVCEDGYEIHDYLEYQPSRAQVIAKRESLSTVRAAAGSVGGRSKSQANAVANRKQITLQNGSKTQAPYPDPVNPDPVPDPEPPRTPPDEQGGRWTSRRGRRRSVEYDLTPQLSPQDEHELWCPEHTGHFHSDCPACRQVEQDFVTLTLSRIPR